MADPELIQPDMLQRLAAALREARADICTILNGVPGDRPERLAAAFAKNKIDATLASYDAERGGVPEPVYIERRNEYEYQVHNLPRNEGVWVQVENFDVKLKRTDEGIVVDVFDMDDEDRGESLASTYAFDSDTQSFQEEDPN